MSDPVTDPATPRPHTPTDRDPDDVSRGPDTAGEAGPRDRKESIALDAPEYDEA